MRQGLLGMTEREVKNAIVDVVKYNHIPVEREI